MTTMLRQPAVPRSLAAGPPRLAAGVELIGEYKKSGFKEPPWIVRRGDGQMIQLSELLYLVAEAADGRTPVDEMAAEVSRRYGRTVSSDNAGFVIEKKLRPLGVVSALDGSSP